jgi:hypothetical protein
LYDVEYAKYFTGIPNIELLPSYCGYVKVKYAPTRSQILIGPGGDANLIHEGIVQGLYKAAEGTELKFARYRKLYQQYEYSDLAAHPAMVMIPYQASIMTIFECYRMQIPMFVPSPSLLVEWHMQFNLLYQRTWPGTYGNRVERSLLPRHPNSTSIISSFDPNNDFSKDAMLGWLQFSDFYQWPHITTFDNWEHLIKLLSSIDLNKVSSDMGEFNVKQEADIKKKWENVLDKVVEGRLARERVGQSLPVEVNDALLASYGTHLSSSDCRKIKFSGRSHPHDPLE